MLYAPELFIELIRIHRDFLIVAKNDMAHIHLAQQIKEHSFERAYECIVHGNISEDSGTVNQPIGRHPKERKKMAVTYRNSRMLLRIMKFCSVLVNLRISDTGLKRAERIG